MRYPTRFALAVILLTSILASSVEPASRDIGVTPHGAARGEDIHGEYWALMVGIDKYQSAPPLESAVKDALGVRDVLAERYGFEPQRTIELLDGEATRTNVEDALYRRCERLERSAGSARRFHLATVATLMPKARAWTRYGSRLRRIRVR